MAAAALATGHYHNSISSIGRGTGAAPIVSKAAYRAGECLFDERNGVWADYRHKAGRVIETFIELPTGAAAWGYDRNRLWNASEAAEPRKNGRNATELELALPHALTHEQRHEMLSAFVRQKVERYGIAADVAVHHGRAGNIHAHVLLSHRQFGAEGFGEVCNPRTVTKYRKGQLKQETVYGISANPDAVKELRKEWADFQNAWFEKLGLDIRVDHRSFEERGIRETPTIHLGPAAAALEARGIATDRGDINRIIGLGNAEVRRLEAEKQRQDAEIIDLAARRAELAAREAAKGRTDEITKDATMDKEPAAARADAGTNPDARDKSHTRDAANQNRREPGPEQVGLSVPPEFGPETLAATAPGAIDRIVEKMRAAEQSAPPIEEPKTFRSTASPEPGRYAELKPTPEPELTAPEAVAAAKADNIRVLPPDEARETLAAWAASQEPGVNQNNPERITLAAEQEARQTHEAAAAPAAPEPANTPTGEPQHAAETEFLDVKTGETLRADLDTPEGREAAASFMEDIAERKFARTSGFERFTSQLGDVLGSIGDRLGAAISYLSDLITPPPKFTPEQVEQIEDAVQRVQETEEARRADEAMRGYVPGYDPEPPGHRDWRGLERNEPAADFARDRGDHEDDLEPD